MATNIINFTRAKIIRFYDCTKEARAQAKKIDIVDALMDYKENVIRNGRLYESGQMNLQELLHADANDTAAACDIIEDIMER